MGVKFFFDEGLGQNLAKGLSLTGKNVEHVLDSFPPGTKDVEWLSYLGENKLVLVTKDKGIRRKPNEKAMLLKYKVVAFYLGGSEKSGHDILKQLVNAWENMEIKAQKLLKQGKAGAFIVRPNGREIDAIPLS
jgi:predicted nuclease of predicted toxin-antitoxin system